MSTLHDFEQLFSKPLTSSRSGAFYNSFPYPTKISPEAIAIYIACATKPGDTVLDSFAGSGSTGIAALLCENPTGKMIEIANELGVSPVWGKRNAVLYEIGTYASFATKTLTSRIQADEFSKLVDDFIAQAEPIVSPFYTATAPNGEPGIIRYVIWSDVLICPNCGSEITYFENGTTRNPVSFKKQISCPNCHRSHSVDEMPFVVENHYDRLLKKTISRKKRVLAWVYGSSDGEPWDRAATAEDVVAFNCVEEAINDDFPPMQINWGDLHRSGYHYGITHLHHFYTARNYHVMSQLWRLAGRYPEKYADALKLLLLSYNATHCTLMTRVVAKQNAKDFVLTGAQSGVLYISKLPVEKNILLGLRRKAKPFEEAYRMLESCSGGLEVRNMSSAKMIEPDKCIDFVFTDPPFGDYIPYAEVNQINELWLSEVTNREDEIIISDAQNKGIDSYQSMLTSVFREVARVTKRDHYIAVVFHAAKATVWGAFADSIRNAGLEILVSSFLDKTQASFKQVVSKGSVQGDPIFLLREHEPSTVSKLTEVQILDQIIKHNPHKTEIDMRHCYSLFIGHCLESGITVNMDAKKVYRYIEEKGENQG